MYAIIHSLSFSNECSWFVSPNRGKGDYFRLGHGTDVHVRKPQMVEGLRGKKIVHVAVGALHCLAVTDTGQVCTDLHRQSIINQSTSFRHSAHLLPWLCSRCVNFSSCCGTSFIDSHSTFPDTSDLSCYTAYFLLYNTFPQNKFNNVSTSLPMMRGSYSILDHFKRLLRLSAWSGAFTFSSVAVL